MAKQTVDGFSRPGYMQTYVASFDVTRNNRSAYRTVLKSGTGSRNSVEIQAISEIFTREWRRGNCVIVVEVRKTTTA